jgi:hypothetical protein
VGRHHDSRAVEAVQEFQVIANNPSAEHGRNSGAMVSVITKGGTNQFSGSLFEFHRDQTMRARGLFEAKKPPFRRNDYGGSIGGPIKRDSTFFFFSFEGVREQTPNAFSTSIETKQLVDWVKANRPNSIAAQLFTKYPAPEYPSTGLVDLGSPLPGANIWRTTPDGIPDVGTINVTQNGPVWWPACRSDRPEVHLLIVRGLSSPLGRNRPPERLSTSGFRIENGWSE